MINVSYHLMLIKCVEDGLKVTKARQDLRKCMKEAIGIRACVARNLILNAELSVKYDNFKR